MKLGILVTSDKHLKQVIGLVHAAVEKGLQVAVFCMDKGTLLINHQAFKDLCMLEGINISLCRHSAEKMNIDLQKISKDIVCGSQFNNAIMQHEADKVIVL